MREDLRILPGEMYTEELAVENKIHELDPPHIQEALLHEYEEKQQGTEKESRETRQEKEVFELRRAKVGRVVPLDQEKIDIERMMAVIQVIKSELARAESTQTPVNFGVRHLWFPKNNVNIIELRDGNPPADADRPKHLRRFDITVDILNPPQRIQDLLERRGIKLWNFRDAYDKAQRTVNAQIVTL